MLLLCRSTDALLLGRSKSSFGGLLGDLGSLSLRFSAFSKSVSISLGISVSGLMPFWNNSVLLLSDSHGDGEQPRDENPLLVFFSWSTVGRINEVFASNIYGLFGCSSHRSINDFKFSLVEVSCGSFSGSFDYKWNGFANKTGKSKRTKCEQCNLFSSFARTFTTTHLDFNNGRYDVICFAFILDFRFDDFHILRVLFQPHML